MFAAIAAALILPACGGGPSGQKTQTPTPSDPDIETLADEGREHVELGSPVTYQTDPPTSGPHYEEIVQEGGFFDHDILAPYLVHSMEHGGVIIYYSPAVTADQLMELRDLVKGHTKNYSQIVCLPRNDAKVLPPSVDFHVTTFAT